jgi:hypothetical protein
MRLYNSIFRGEYFLRDLERNLQYNLRFKTLRTPKQGVMEIDKSMTTVISQEANSLQLCTRNPGQKNEHFRVAELMMKSSR